MSTIPQNTFNAKLPSTQLQDSLRAFAEPVTALRPDARLQEVTRLMLQGLITNESPVVTQIARGSTHTDAAIWLMAKRLYRLLDNPRFSHRTLRKGLAHRAQPVVAQEAPAYAVIAVDPVNFEKPYTTQLEGVSQVIKRTPPTLNGDKRVTRGYPALTATIVNLKQPATTYANWFSYESTDLVSLHRELERAFRCTRALFSNLKLRLVGDAGLDDSPTELGRKCLPRSPACTVSL